MTILKHIGTIKGFGGSLSISYFPELDKLAISAENIADRRIKSVILIAEISIVDQLRSLLDEVDKERNRLKSHSIGTNP